MNRINFVIDESKIPFPIVPQLNSVIVGDGAVTLQFNGCKPWQNRSRNGLGGWDGYGFAFYGCPH